MVAGWIGGLFSEVPAVAGVGSDDACFGVGCGGASKSSSSRVASSAMAFERALPSPPSDCGLALWRGGRPRWDSWNLSYGGGVHRDDAVLVGRRGWCGRAKVVASFALVGLLRLAS